MSAAPKQSETLTHAVIPSSPAFCKLLTVLIQRLEGAGDGSHNLLAGKFRALESRVWVGGFEQLWIAVAMGESEGKAVGNSLSRSSLAISAF